MIEIERFKSFISPEPNTGCWLWTGGLQSKGYGFFCRADASMVLAHRFSFELERGPIGPGLQLDHVCLNKSCVNPAHLDEVTAKENMLRRYRAARGEPVRGPQQGHNEREGNMHDPGRNRTCDLRLRNAAVDGEPQQNHGPARNAREQKEPPVHNRSTMERSRPRAC